MDGDGLARIIYFSFLLLALGAWAMVEYRGRMGLAMRSFFAWAMIFVAVMSGYGLWNDLRRDVLPRQAVVADGRIELPRAPDGHYYLTLTIGDHPVRFLVDTGATNVVLGSRDAAALGIDPATLVYTGQAQTANGTVRTARVTLEDVALGPYRDARLGAAVTDGAMEGSLLGMDYLGRYRIEIDSGQMVLSR